MTVERTTALVDRFIDRLRRFEEEGEGALEALVELFAEGAELVNPALELAGEHRTGHDELRRFWRTYHNVLGRAESRFDRITTSEDSAGLFWTTHASGREGDGAIHYDGATLLVFDENGRIRRFRAYFDLDALAQTMHRGETAPPSRSDEGERSEDVRDPRQPVGYG